MLHFEHIVYKKINTRNTPSRTHPFKVIALFDSLKTKWLQLG